MVGKVPTITKSLFKLPFSVWLLILQGFLLINTEIFFPPQIADRIRFVILTYVVLTLAGISVFGASPPWFKQPAEVALRYFVTGLVTTTMLLSLFTNVSVFEFLLPWDTTDPVKQNLALVAFEAFIVAASEETVFRGILPYFVGWLPAQLIFGVFHYVAYGGDWSGILFASLAGMLFYQIAARSSIYTAMGVHTAWNIFALLG